MPSADRFHATVRIDVDLTCDAPPAGDPVSNRRHPAHDAAILSLLDVTVATDAGRHVQLEALEARVLSSDADGTAGSVPSASSDETRVAQAGARLPGIDWALNELFADETDAAEGARDLRQRSVLKGLIWNASVVVVDCLFEDVVTLATTPVRDLHVRDTHVLSQLPPTFARHYDRAFAQKFLAAMIEVTSRLTAAPVYPQTIAHELALKIVLDEAERGAEQLKGALPYGWRAHLDAVLFQDLDIDSLYVADDPDDDTADGFPPTDFGSWFIPYSRAAESVPYANDEPKEPAGR
ncbi:hypothetical protein [Microbacterium sp.]|uniref:hypothetical protein n=1 Tax=Microbacterium sp. TaxID=51671 RepID=UPI003736D6B6